MELTVISSCFNFKFNNKYNSLIDAKLKLKLRVSLSLIPRIPLIQTGGSRQSNPKLVKWKIART